MLEAGSGSIIIHGISSIWGWLDEFGLGKWEACYKGIVLEDSGREVSGREMVGANAGQLWGDEMAWFWGRASSDLPSVRSRAGCHLYFIDSSVIAITLTGYNTPGRDDWLCVQGKCQKEGLGLLRLSDGWLEMSNWHNLNESSSRWSWPPFKTTASNKSMKSSYFLLKIVKICYDS